MAMRPKRPRDDPPPLQQDFSTAVARGAPNESRAANPPPGPPSTVPPALASESQIRSRRRPPPQGHVPPDAVRDLEPRAKPPVVIPGRSPDEVYEVVLESAIDQGEPGQDNTWGHGTVHTDELPARCGCSNASLAGAGWVLGLLVVARRRC